MPIGVTCGLPIDQQLDAFHGGFGDALLDRKPGIYGALNPSFKCRDVLRWIEAQVSYSNEVRDRLLEVQRAFVGLVHEVPHTVGIGEGDLLSPRLL